MALAPDVKVNCVAPGLVKGTELTRDGFARQAILDTTSLTAVAGQVVQFCRADTYGGAVLMTEDARRMRSGG